jgi:D-alanyl-D-alanine carboxypeptidase/D-alanyl-D-alanine-endopeptidase (penicillin-binding protein 4)
MRAALVAIALAFAASSSGALDAPDGLGARLDASLNARALRGARVAVRVESESGRVLYERSGDVALAPASNLKVLTALAALRALGPTHTFETRVLATRAPDAQGSVETLYVRGGGDPALTSEDLWRLASDLRRAGLRRVKQGIVLDDSYFDSVRWNPAWGPVTARAYYAPIGALTVNYGAYSVVVSPAEATGEAPRVLVDPPVPFLHVTNQARTGPQRAAHTLRVERRALPRGEEVVVSGTLAKGSPPETSPRSVLDPTGYFGAMLELQLEAIGIAVEGEVRPGGVPADAAEILAFHGAPLSDVLRRFLKFSNNQIGEALVKALGARATGRPGSWQNGLAAMRAELESAGLPLAGSVLLDGSGLSHENRASPRLLVAALRTARESFEYGAEFEAGLPIAGADGTLERRAARAGPRVRAKTGLLTRVSGLSGYARLASGERVVFSILVNGFRGSPHGVMRAVDGFAAALVAD